MSIQLQIETTAVCNARCHFCVYAQPINDRPKGMMSMARYRGIIVDAATIPEISDVCLTGLGESLLDPHLDERIAYSRDKMPDRDVCVFTNGTYLSPDRFDRLAEAGLGTLNVSLNATTPEKRKAIMGLDDFNQVVSNISYAMAHRGDMKIRVTAVVNEDMFSEAEALELVRLWGHWRHHESGHVELVSEGNWAGDNRSIRAFDPDEACVRALTQFYVLWDGRVSACCFDPLARMEFGRVPEQSIREVYNSEKYVRFRELHSQDKASEVEICKGCSRI